MFAAVQPALKVTDTGNLRLYIEGVCGREMTSLIGLRNTVLDTAQPLNLTLSAIFFCVFLFFH